MALKCITLVTGNHKKVEEITKLLRNSHSFELVSKDVDLPEIQGNEMDIMRAKCKAAVDVIDGPVVVEDICVRFNSLGGLPGPYIKWFSQELGPNGLYRLLTGWDDKSAKAVCNVAYCEGKHIPVQDIPVFSGVVDGLIVEPRGPEYSDWYRCFEPFGYSQTYAEMEKSIDNHISHRFLAFNSLSQYLNKNLI